MASLSREHRNQLAKSVLLARDAAERGARKSLEALAAHEPDPYRHLNEAQRLHRRQLRAQARQLGDGESETKRGAYEIKHLVEKVAYDQWHRLLFARFLIENNLLIHPDYQDTGTAVSFEDCEELAPSLGKRDGWGVAAEFAARDLPQIFRADDAAGGVELPTEDRNELVQLVTSLPKDVFLADDALGWVYQFWQAKRKEEVNASGNKIGADELSPVTQLFTEDYMVLFLLHNTLGAWWAGKKLQNADFGLRIESEADARAAVALPGVDWQYLRFVKNDAGAWVPASGVFSGWPKSARELRVLDPCMGSGHFLVFALPILAQMRATEEGLSPAEACAAVLRDNLFGLELDPRCTQIGAFNLALAAWKLGRWQKLPPLNIACSGLAPNAPKESWLRLAGDNDRARRGMEQLYDLFAQAPVLGSLINPRSISGDLLESSFHDLRPLLDKGLQQERSDEAVHELAVTARGLAKAAELLAGKFTLVATNVPFLGRTKQDEGLSAYCDRVHPNGKADLATAFIERCVDFCAPNGSAALVSPQNWLFLGLYKKLRQGVLESCCWNLVSRLGAKAFQTQMWDFGVVLLALTSKSPSSNQSFAGWDISDAKSANEKSALLQFEAVRCVNQKSQVKNPNSAISFSDNSEATWLSDYAESYLGICTGDTQRFARFFWEAKGISDGWTPLRGTTSESQHWHGMSKILFWEEGDGTLLRFVGERMGVGNEGSWLRGKNSWGRAGIVVSLMGSLPASLYAGELYDDNVAVLIPKDEGWQEPIAAFCLSPQFASAVRSLNQKLAVKANYLVNIPFDLAHWQRVAGEKYPNGLPKPFSSDPTQWLFNGHPKGADEPLQVAVARLLGYRWPRQTGSSFPDCPALEADGLERFADEDGIVCISATKGEEPASERVRALLAAAYGAEWTPGKLNELLAQADYAGKPLEDWLRNGFFEQHCAVFHQRPFIWHVWDGHPDGFSALVNYHRLDRAMLEKLTYAYLGDWIRRQQAAVEGGESGSDARLQAAKELQTELKNILEGEPPYDIFVRWKPLARQPIGWEPDVNDGVRLNIRPFLSAKNVGKKGAGILRIRPGIKWDKDRGKEPSRPKDEFPWFWNWDEETTDFKGRGEQPDGNRWNACHYTNEFKRKARSM